MSRVFVMRSIVSVFVFCAALSLGLLAVSSPVDACSPPPEEWELAHHFPADGAIDVPVNTVLGFWFDHYGSRPSSLSEGISLEVTRDGDEIVEGMLIPDEELQLLRFVPMFPLAEGIVYTATVRLAAEWEGGEEEISFSFTTGDGLDEAPPAFSGLQSARLTEDPRPVNNCCDIPGTDCVGNCDPSACVYCWTVDWTYRPVVHLSLQPALDEAGHSRPWIYRIYEVDGPAGVPGGNPVAIFQPGQSRVTLPFDGDVCYLAQATDLFDRSDSNTNVRCVTQADMMPVGRREIPEPPEERLEICGNEDVPDVGLPSDMSDDDMEPDIPGGGQNQADSGDEMPPVVDVRPGSSSDDDCSCAVPSRPKPTQGIFWGLALLGAVWLRRKKR